MIRRLNVLDRLHSRILDIVATGLPLLKSSLKDADLVGMSYLRNEMIATIADYTHYVHHYVLEPATRGDDAERLQLALDIKMGAMRLEGAYRAFTKRWEHRDGKLNWPEYRLSAIVLMKQIREQVRNASRWEPCNGQAAAHPADVRSVA